MPAAMRRIYAYASSSTRRGAHEHLHRSYYQRCAVRITYVGNRISGQWKAHGRYLPRKSATHRAAQRQAGFDAAQDKLDLPTRLNDWQRSGDPRLWKIILSPEFGDQFNMQELARGVMAGVERELDTQVEWIAVAHYNTGHPHVHIAMRG